MQKTGIFYRVDNIPYKSDEGISMMLRKYHRFIALIFFVPLFIIATTGILLQLRSNWEWIQPKTISTVFIPESPLLSYENIVNIVESKEKIEQIIYRPEKNNISIRLKDGVEIQMNAQTGEILKKAKRRTSFIMELHEGSIGKSFLLRYGVFLMSAFGLIFLIISGLIIFPRKKYRDRTI